MNFSKKTGFSLAETMIALAIGLPLAGAAAWFLVEGTRISLKTSAASTNDLAQWGIQTGITVDTKTANGMVMYQDFLKATLSSSANRLKNSQTGNVMILTQSQQNSTTNSTYIQITGYVYNSTTSSFNKFSYTVKDSEKVAPDALETILANNFDTFTLTPIATNVKTISTSFPLDRAFLCRDAKGQSGELNLQVYGGNVSLSTSTSKIIETSFFVRG